MTVLLLADENFPLPVIDGLRADGYDVASVARQCPGIDDRAVLALARDTARRLLTFDSDFGDLVFPHPSRDRGRRVERGAARAGRGTGRNVRRCYRSRYAMLMNDVRSAVESVGLDPQIGFLHALRPARAALALDLMEEFRPLLADRLALTLINRRQVNAEDFDEHSGGAVTLKDDVRRAVVTAYQERKQEALMHPLLELSVALGLVPFVQARLLARAVRGDAEGYLPFCPK